MIKQDVIADLLGNLSLTNYIVSLIFVSLTLILRWIWKTIDSVRHNHKTPHKFSFSYWFRDNIYHKLLSLIGNLISIFIILRFSNDIIGMNFSYFLTIVVGLGLDYFVDRLKKMQKRKRK